MSAPWPDPNPEPVPEGCHKWRIVTKPIGPHRKADDDPGKVYYVIAANAAVVDGHLCLWDAQGTMKEIRANGTFETITRVEPAHD